jgi:NitT/TauT family transport system substrate-binding protein
MRVFALLVCCMVISAVEVPVLTVGHVGHDHQLALYLAASRGAAMRPLSGEVWLRELKAQEVYELLRGETVLAQLNLSRVKGGAAMPAALSRGDIDIGFGGLAPVVLAIDKGAELKVVAPCNADGDMLLLRPGLTADSWAAFVALARSSEQPLRIGYKAPMAVAYLILKAGLEHEGLRHGPEDFAADGQPVQVRLIDERQATSLIPALASGALDGMAMNQPVVAQAVDKGLGQVVCDLADLPPEGRWRRHPCCCVAATRATCEQHPAELEAFLQLIAAAGRELERDVAQAVPVAAAWCNQSEAVETLSLPTVAFVSSFDEGWRQGELNWYAMMAEMGVFSGRLSPAEPGTPFDPASARSLVVEERFLAAALARLPEGAHAP